MSVFYGGRLLITPTTASLVDDTGLANKNLTVGNILALVGCSDGGKPNVPLRFGSPQQAKDMLRGGELLTAILKAFDPSSQTGGPSEVVAVRVNPAAQSALTLLSPGALAVADLVSTDYGFYTNQIKVKVESGSTAGKKLTTQLGQNYYTQDNVAGNAFSVLYTGAEATAALDVDITGLDLKAPNSTIVQNILFATYDTVEKIVDRINAVPGFTATILDGNGTKSTVNALDRVNNVDCKTAAAIATANLQAQIDWFNSVGEGFITATRKPGVNQLLANIPFTYLAGGSDGTVTNTEWSNAYTTLQQTDVQWVVPISSSASIHAMNDAHCSFMSTVGKSERRGFVGTAFGTSDASAITAAKALNSDRTSLLHLGFYDYDAAGVLVLFPPYILAALVGGAFSGVNPGTPLTNKSIKVRGLERDLRNPTDTDQLILGGVLCVENTPKGFKVVQSITTWLTNDNYNRVEVSVGAAVDFVSRNVRDALDDLRGEKGTPILLQRAVSIADSRLRELARPEPTGPGVITGDSENPAYRGITATLEGDVLRVQFECQPVIGVNYVLVTIFAKAYTGTATA